MNEITGPGRRPGRRDILVLSHRYEPGVVRMMDEPRPGRLVAVIRRMRGRA